MLTASQPYTSLIFDGAVDITPMVSLPRSCIPFQWIDGTPSRIFRILTNPPLLDAPGNVLVSKMNGNRQLVGVELTNTDVFVLYRFSASVRMMDVRKIALKAKKSISNFRESTPHKHVFREDWWQEFTMEKSFGNNKVLRSYLENRKAVLNMAGISSVGARGFAKTYDLHPLDITWIAQISTGRLYTWLFETRRPTLPLATLGR